MGSFTEDFLKPNIALLSLAIHNPRVQIFFLTFYISGVIIFIIMKYAYKKLPFPKLTSPIIITALLLFFIWLGNTSCSSLSSSHDPCIGKLNPSYINRNDPGLFIPAILGALTAMIIDGTRIKIMNFKKKSKNSSKHFKRKQ